MRAISYNNPFLVHVHLSNSTTAVRHHQSVVLFSSSSHISSFLFSFCPITSCSCTAAQVTMCFIISFFFLSLSLLKLPVFIVYCITFLWRVKWVFSYVKWWQRASGDWYNIVSIVLDDYERDTECYSSATTRSTTSTTRYDHGGFSFTCRSNYCTPERGHHHISLFMPSFYLFVTGSTAEFKCRWYDSWYKSALLSIQHSVYVWNELGKQQWTLFFLVSDYLELLDSFLKSRAGLDSFSKCSKVGVVLDSILVGFKVHDNIDNKVSVWNLAVKQWQSVMCSITLLQSIYYLLASSKGSLVNTINAIEALKVLFTLTIVLILINAILLYIISINRICIYITYILTGGLNMALKTPRAQSPA